ncbi:SDR family oxidoreductase [Planomonospora venezuelensis]|uniref:NAD(P)-dependent dehydrogenase (Short-subunit alcohol dehydrogenase family) n=1 Tax=Planomonospora venezuelensis TaxID=1999 RepID=A0A841D515_PLAVE|nr:SDR family oxidoreductase [Planomonospora venezuelensis]MBB5964053.1 NAD(P)-dependent dehydrogenase (short-subunit alcohol dehydrogenase family) [Planomonospora venezuelensis]GIM99676.1 short-chain dehydrogenase [Planomonospora venezuelensis]
MAGTTPLAGTAALITGGGSGIGLACARRLAADGAAVTICGRTESRLKEAAGTIGARYVVADVTDEEQIAAAVRFAAAPAPLRAVVHSAGGSTSIGPLPRLDADAWRATLELNATGTMLTLKHAARAMARNDPRGGAFVAISSIAASTTHRWFGAYGVSKAAVDHLVKLGADELGPVGVRVNGIRPGLVRTELVAGITDPGPVLDDYLACMPLGRIGEPGDIAEAARFLAGPESSWITGQVVDADGGHHLRRGPDYRAIFEPMFGADALHGAPPEE